MAIGIAGILQLIPSHVGRMTAINALRVPLSLVVTMAFFLVLAVSTRQWPTRKHFRYGIPIAICMVSGQYALYAGADAFARHGISGVMFPLGASGSIVIFTFYSRLILREPFTRRMWGALVLVVAGICLLAIQ